LTQNQFLFHNIKEGNQTSLSIPVAIKVLHPDILENFSRDLKVLNSVISFLAKIVPSLEWLSIKESVMEFGDLMNKQVIF
jgi:predicted unusual protein kinase regulating ubiquinone biosynthesis (AarF/ABC1/UbiB family)